jgi:hypothetical protein
VLSDSKIKSAQGSNKRYRIADGDQLYIEIMPSGKKYWLFRYTREGKRRWTQFGEYPMIGLKEAREIRDRLKKKFCRCAVRISYLIGTWRKMYIPFADFQIHVHPHIIHYTVK